MPGLPPGSGEVLPDGARRERPAWPCPISVRANRWRRRSGWLITVGSSRKDGDAVGLARGIRPRRCLPPTVEHGPGGHHSQHRLAFDHAASGDPVHDQAVPAGLGGRPQQGHLRVSAGLGAGPAAWGRRHQAGVFPDHIRAAAMGARVVTDAQQVRLRRGPLDLKTQSIQVPGGHSGDRTR
jgi:hypothetical protein